jgi:hypothetical protein
MKHSKSYLGSKYINIILKHKNQGLLSCLMAKQLCEATQAENCRGGKREKQRRT